MKSPDRFYLPELADAGEGGSIALDHRQSSHATRVRRLSADEEVELFDGLGRHARGRIVRVGRRGEVEVEVGAIVVEPPTQAPLHLGVAVPRGERMETLLDMATQLGVDRVTPLLFAHGTPQQRRGGRRDRYLRVLAEACKQCRRNHLPHLDEATPLADWLAQATSAVDARFRWLADPGGELPVAAGHAAGGVVVVGPEGGLDEAERAQVLAAGFRPVAIGGHILRVETAAVAIVAAARLVLQAQAGSSGISAFSR